MLLVNFKGKTSENLNLSLTLVMLTNKENTRTAISYSKDIRFSHAHYRSLVCNHMLSISRLNVDINNKKMDIAYKIMDIMCMECTLTNVR